MRSPDWWLIVLGLAVIGFVVLLPLVGFLVTVVAGLVIAAAAVAVGVPLLQRLPWFRDHVRVEEHDGSRTYHLGDRVTVSYDDDDEPQSARPEAGQRPSDDDVIDVEGRIISH